jgi:hypothetical protein
VNSKVTVPEGIWAGSVTDIKVAVIGSVPARRAALARRCGDLVFLLQDAVTVSQCYGLARLLIAI